MLLLQAADSFAALLTYTHRLMKATVTYLAALMLGLALPGRAQTIVYVAPGATGAGSSWADARGDLAAAMRAAEPGTEIWVRQGTYTPTTCAGACTGVDREMSFELRPGVSVIGGFVGNETSRAGASSSNVTVLSGDIGVANDPLDNSYNVVFGINVGTAATLENLTISGGYANRVAASGSTDRGRAGAGLYLNGTGSGTVASPTLRDCRFVGNDAIGRGGAVYCNGFGGTTSPRFEYCEFAFNSARADGGAIAVDGTNGTVDFRMSDCDIRHNGTVYDMGTGQSGGGMFISAQNGTAAFTLDRCRFANNTADVSLGAQANGNTSANGGAIYMTNSGVGTMVLDARNSIFQNNSSFSAGAIYNLGGLTKLSGVTVYGNEARGDGGSGGGLYVNEGSAEVVNSIFWANEVILNPFGGKDVRFVNGTVTVSYTLVEAPDRATFFSRSNPSTGNDVLNDGPGMIYGTDPVLAFGSGVPAPQATSPAVDAGNTGAAATAGGDYFGAARVQSVAVDLGAVETSGAPLPVQLIAFTAEARAGAISLEWLVASESSLAGYRLERSDDGEAFVEIGDVLAMGAGDYGYDDRAVIGGRRYYYRLRSVDLDGSDYLSPVVTAELPDGTADDTLFTRIYPNPTAGQMRVTLSPRTGARTVYATVLDITGRKLRMWPLTTDGNHVLELGDLPGGQYVLRLTEGTRTQTAAFSIDH